MDYPRIVWMRCRQLWREAREAAERFMEVLDELNYRDSKQESTLGDYLGKLTNELKKREHIVEFVSGGPKK